MARILKSKDLQIGGQLLIPGIAAGKALKMGAGGVAAAEPGIDYAIPNTRAYWFSTAAVKLGTFALADYFNDWESTTSLGGWSVAGTGTLQGTVGGLGILLGGTGATGSVRQTAPAYHVGNLRTSKWFFATRYKFAGTTADHQLFFGLNALTTAARVGIGFDGAASTTKCYAGLFAGIAPLTPRTAQSTISTRGPSASLTNAYIYNDGVNIRASLDSEVEFIACAAADVPSEAGWIVPLWGNGIGVAGNGQIYVDWTFLATER